MRGRVFRRPVWVVAVAVVIGLAVADRGHGPADEPTAAIPAAPASATLDPDAQGSVWFCTEGTSMPGDFADHSVVVANPTGEAVTAEVSVFPATAMGSVTPEAPPHTLAVPVPARSQAEVRLADVVVSRFTAAMVEIDSGSAVVEQRVQGPTGIDVTPCAGRSSENWHFAAGSTRRDARLLFTVFNPFPGRAVVSFTFSTDEGAREPQPLRGVLVPARSLVVVDATDLVPRYASVATTISSQAGRVVAGRLQVFDGTEGLEGLTAGSGIPDPRTLWVFPTGPATGEAVEHLVVYNPNDREAAVDVTVWWDAPEPGDDPLPIPVAVPAHQRVAVVMGDPGPYPLPSESVAYRPTTPRPEQSGFWAAVQATNGVPVVAERVSASPAASTPAGVATTAGMSASATRYLIAANRADGAEVAVAVVNPSPDSIARVTVSKVADGRTQPLAEMDAREVAPRGRLVVPVDRLTGGHAYGLLVEASQPVVVSRTLLVHHGTGMASGASVPFAPVPLDPAAL
ncbi:DUF5719 family protein [Candidatus Poriferisocius sp.]|uniref:DUF5719 family protein n=1 Tax=Candidatus Poriferisocius sp. TaxID=3101276 RepID=UPI003B5AF4F3